MKLPSALFSLALAGAVIAQDGVPKCAQPCVNNFLTNGIGNCGRDVTCICENKQFLGEIACCIAPVCDAAQQSAAIAYAGVVCGAVGVKNLPTTVACTTGSASATGSPTGSATGAATPAATTAATTESSNYGPRPTAAAGLGAIGGIMAAVALL